MGTPGQQTAQHLVSEGRLRLFISYARADAAAVRLVEEGLETLHYQLWVDRKLDGGQAWWNEILQRIRDCDAVIAAVSPALLDSEAAALERGYARALGKPILPILVAPLLTELLPADLAPLQLIDYTTASPSNAFQLAGALASLSFAPPLPDPLPSPPAVPVSYMSGLAEKVRAPRLDLEDQLLLVASLRAAVERPRERDAAVQLLGQLKDRRDLYYRAWVELMPLLDGARPRSTSDGGAPTGGASADGASAGSRPTRESSESGRTDGAARPPEQRTQTSTVPAGWYPDPSHRHQSRWFDGDWTAFAADNGRVVEDPDF